MPGVVGSVTFEGAMAPCYRVRLTGSDGTRFQALHVNGGPFSFDVEPGTWQVQVHVPRRGQREKTVVVGESEVYLHFDLTPDSWIASLHVDRAQALAINFR